MSRAFQPAFKVSVPPEPGPDRALSARLGGVAKDTAASEAELRWGSFFQRFEAEPR
jgi:hypothetical protein